MTDQPIKIVAILGSMSPTSNTAKTLAVLEADMIERGIEFTLIDPSSLTLPFPGQELPDADTDAIQTLVTDADGLIISTPEYHGSYSSVIKLVIDNLGFPSTLKGKPVALLGVAAGALGATKALEHLRSSLSHVGAYVLPAVVSIAAIHNQFDENDEIADDALAQRLKKLNQSLLDFIAR